MVSSFAGVASVAGQAPYCSNKHALHGFFHSLRQDLALQGHSGISVTLCVLGYIGTKNALNLAKSLPIGKSIVKPEPVDECALAIIKGVALRKQQLYFPWYISILETVHFFLPNFVESVNQVLANDKSAKDLWKW